MGGYIRRVLGFFLTGAMLAGAMPAVSAAEFPVKLEEAGLSIAWVETENRLAVLGRDHLVTEYKVLGRYGMMGASTWGDYGLRNADGELIVPIQYGATLPGGTIGNGYFATALTEDTFTDYLGNVLPRTQAVPAWDAPELDVYREPGPDGMLESGKWGYGDPRTGEHVLPAIYDRAGSFREGIGIVSMGEETFAIDRTGAKLFDLSRYSATAPYFQEGRLSVQDRETGKWGFVDRTGALVIPAQWDNPYSAGSFFEGLAAVSVADVAGYLTWGYIDLEGNVAVPCVLDHAGEFRNGLAIVEYQGTQGILKHPGQKDAASPWAAEELAQAGEAGYITPACANYQTFEITRLQFVQLVVNYLEKTAGEALEPAAADTFSDTADEAARKAYAAGIVQGTGDGRFQPGGLLTREQLAAMLWRALELTGAAAGPADLSAYADGAQVSPWAQESLAALISLGIMKGTEASTLAPKAPCTVEQAIALVWRAAE